MGVGIVEIARAVMRIIDTINGEDAHDQNCGRGEADFLDNTKAHRQ